MTIIEIFELLSYVITVIGLPFAIIIYLYDKKKERENEEEEIYEKLSDEYADFLKLVLENSDLHLSSHKTVELNEEQKEKKLILLELLVSLFERAYILAYESKMDRQKQRRWQSWEDYMIEWCRREDFRNYLPQLLEGEDEEFIIYITNLSKRINPALKK